MFNRKLKERVARLERLLDGEKGTAGGLDWAWGVCMPWPPEPPVAGLRDKVEALATKLGVEFKKHPDVHELGTWEAVEKRVDKIGKKSGKRGETK